MNNFIEATISNGNIKGEDVRYVVRVQTFAISCATRFCNDHQQSTRTSLQLYVACSHVGKPSDLFVYTPEGKTKNIAYSKALQ
jgi:hypothetical protein